ncbi:glutathione peroxidase [Cupriavidus taiwanensis]|uniref:Glutathione peroxidase n=1 Tax=Cupriavidus taiwanensis TaxID=164546 RepID=A0A375ITQ2_9BURK|nr:glutathione peroxidase [Cupriavidus taiwanensis]SPR95967.1 putative glutathione peroxydase [Cupriavidus taiwanensis]
MSRRPLSLRQSVPLAVALTLAAASAALLPAPLRAADKPAAPVAAGTCPASLNFTFPRLQDDAPQNLCQYAGKVVLVVNTASYCGFTPQYEGLEALYAKYNARGLVVLGFPSNDFSQEPGSQKEIADFCYNTYGVKFPMLGKSHVRGSEANPMYALLAKQTGTAPKWNFYKYLIGRDGKVVASYGSRTAPDDKELVAKIESLLAAPR